MPRAAAPPFVGVAISARTCLLFEVMIFMLRHCFLFRLFYNHKKIFQIFISIVLFISTLWATGGQTILLNITQANLVQIVSIVLLLKLSVLCAAVRWWWFLRPSSIAISLRRAVDLSVLGNFLNQIMPGGIVGDISRVYMARGDNLRTGFRLGIADRMSGVSVLLSLLCGGLSGSWILGVAVIILGHGFIFIRVKNKYHQTRKGSFAVIYTGASLSLLNTFLMVLAYFYAVRALGVDVQWSYEMAVMIALILSAMLVPLSVAGWGIREGAASLTASFVFLTPAQAVSASVIYGLSFLLACSLLAALRLLVKMVCTERT